MTASRWGLMEAARLRGEPGGGPPGIGNWKHEKLDIKTARQIMNGFTTRRAWEEALGLLDTMHRQLTEVDVWEENKAMGSMLIGRWERSVEFLRKVRRDGLRPDVVTYSLAITACERAHSGPWGRVLFLLGSMMQGLVAPDTIAVCSAMSAFERSAGWEKAINLAQLLDEPTTVPCDVAISACAKQSDWSQALRYLCQVESTRGRPTAVTYVAALNACKAGRRWSRSMELLDEAQQRASPLCDMQRKLVTSTLGNSRMWRIAMEMASGGSQKSLAASGDIGACNIAMSACAKGSEWAAAARLFRSVQSGGCRPTIVTFGTAIEACDKGEEWSLVLELFDHLRAEGTQANTHVYNTVIAAQGVSTWERALEIRRDMDRHGAEPDDVTEGATAATLARRRAWWAAAGLFCEAHERRLGRSAIARIGNFAVLAGARGRKWRCSVELMDLMKERRVAVQLESQLAVLRSQRAQPRMRRKILGTVENWRARRGQLFEDARGSDAPPLDIPRLPARGEEAVGEARRSSGGGLAECPPKPAAMSRGTMSFLERVRMLRMIPKAGRRPPQR